MPEGTVDDDIKGRSSIGDFNTRWPILEAPSERSVLPRPLVYSMKPAIVKDSLSRPTEGDRQEDIVLATE